MTTVSLSKGFQGGNDNNDYIPGLSVLVSVNLLLGASENVTRENWQATDRSNYR